MEEKFPSSFCYVQTPVSKRLFLIEGHHSKTKACVELVMENGPYFKPELRAFMNYRRMLSSVTALDDNNLVVTGGLNPSGFRAEYYSVENDTWSTITDLNEGRKAHASCSFN